MIGLRYRLASVDPVIRVRRGPASFRGNAVIDPALNPVLDTTVDSSRRFDVRCRLRALLALPDAPVWSFQRLALYSLARCRLTLCCLRLDCRKIGMCSRRLNMATEHGCHCTSHHPGDLMSRVQMPQPFLYFAVHCSGANCTRRIRPDDPPIASDGGATKANVCTGQSTGTVKLPKNSPFARAEFGTPTRPSSRPSRQRNTQ